MEPSHAEFWKRAQELGIDVHIVAWDEGLGCVEYPDGEPFLCAEDWQFVTCASCKMSPDYEDWLKEGGKHAAL
jgi:hypothetical protein